MDNKQPFSNLNPSKTVDSHHKSSLNWYLDLIPITTGGSPAIMITNTIFFLITMLMCLFYANLDQIRDMDQENDLFYMLNTFTMKKQISQVFVIITLILELIIVQSIILHHIKKMEKIPLISSINKFIDPLLMPITEINILLAYASFIDSSLFEVKVLCFSVASITALFSDYFLMPKNNPNDMLYTIETFFIALSRLSYLSSITIVLINEYSELFPLSIIGSIIIGIFQCYLFYHHGTIAYSDVTSSILLNFKYSFFMAIILTISLKMFIPIVIQTPITLCFIILLLVNLKSKMSQFQSFQKDQITLEDLKSLKIIHRRTSKSACIQQKSIKIGQLQIHMQNCLRSNCFCKKPHIYCPQSQSQIKSRNLLLNQAIETTTMYYIKCLFEDLLQKNHHNIQILLCYCEHLLYQMKLILPLSVPIIQLEEQKLDISQQIRLQNLKNTIRELMSKQNQISESNLILQEIIYLQDIYFDLERLENEIVYRNIELWQSFHGVNSKTQIFKKLEHIFTLKEKIQALLLNSQKYHSHNELKRLISFYHLYLNNDQKKERDLISLSSHIAKKPIVKHKDYLHGFYEIKIDAEDCFNPNTVIIIGKYCLNNALTIQNTSKSITELLKYDSNELKSIDISVILPYYLREEHKKLMNAMINDGFVYNDKSLKAIRTLCLKKDQTLASVCKSFKSYTNIFGEIQFACILKVDPIQPVLIVSDLQNKIIQYSSNLDCFIEQYKYDGTNFNHLLQEINHIKQSDKRLSNDIFVPLNYNKKSININIQKIEYKNQDPVLVIMVILPFQAMDTAYSSQPTQFQTSNELSQLKKKQKYYINIFVKDQNFTPTKHLPNVINIVRILCVFGFFYSIFPIIVAILFKYNCENVLDYFDAMVNFVKFQKLPFILGIYYYQSQMNMFNNTQHAHHHIEYYHSQYIQKSQESKLLKTLFDKSIFTESYVQVGKSSSFGEQISFELKDVFFNLGSFISSYSSSNSDVSFEQFGRFNRLMIPFYDNIQIIKDKFFLSYNQVYQFIYLPDYIYIVIMIGIFIVAVAITCYNFFKLRMIGDNLIKMLSNPQKSEYLAIKAYWRTLKKFLPVYYQDQNAKKSSINEFSVCYFEEKSIETNRKQYQTLFLVLVPMIGILAIMLILQGLKFIQIQNVRKFQQHGSVFFDRYPSSIILSYSLLQRHYNQTVIKDWNQKQPFFEKVLLSFEQVGELSYIAAPLQDNSQFYTLSKEYYYDNPCKYLPLDTKLEGFTQQKCSSYAEGHITSGIPAFKRYNFDLIRKSNMKGETFQKEEINNLVQSLILMNSFVEQIIEACLMEYYQKINNLIKNTLIFNSICTAFFSIVCYYYINGKFIGKIKDFQKVYKQAYSILMTKDRIKNDKIAQCSLILCGFLQQK